MTYDRSKKGFTSMLKKVLAASLCLMMPGLPLPDFGASGPRLELEDKALADFKSLLNPAQIGNFSELCYDIDSYSQVVLLFSSKVTIFAEGSPGETMTGALIDLAQKANTISDICAIVIAVGTAKDMNGVLRAAKVVNRIRHLGQQSALAQFEDTVSFFDFLQNLKSSKQSNKRKLLNVNNYRRALNWAFDTLPLDGIDAKIIAQKKAKVEDRLNRLADLNQTINGCRVPINKVKDNEVLLADGPVKVSQVERWVKELDRWGEQQNRAANYVEQIFGMLRKMIAETAHTPEETNGALTILNNFVRDGVFASVGYQAPRDKATIRGTIVVIENPFVQFEAEQNVAEGIIPLTRRKKFIEVEDGLTVFYKNHGSKTPGQCVNRDTQLEKWVFENNDILIDPYIMGEWIADEVRVCPTGSGLALLKKYEIATFGVPIPQDEVEKNIRDATKSIEENCKKRNIEQLFKDLEEIKTLADGSRSSGLRVDRDPCKMTEAQVDNMRPAVAMEIEGITNMAEWLDYYNSKFNSFIRGAYNLALADNAVENSIRSFTRDYTDFMRGSDGSYGSQSGWDPNAGNMMNPEQMKFLNAWKRPEISCSLPRSLARRYKGTPGEDVIANAATRQAEYYSLIQQCITDQKSSKMNEDTLEETFLALLDALVDLAEAKAEIFMIELQSGAFKGEGGRKPVGCYEAVKPPDVDLAAAKTGVILVESIEALNQGIDEIYKIEVEREQRLKKKAQEVEMRNIKAISDLRQADIVMGIERIDPNTNDSYNYGNALPSFIEQRKRTREFGDDPSEPTGL